MVQKKNLRKLYVCNFLISFQFSEKIFQEGETITGLPLSLIQALADKLKKTDLALIHNEEMDEIIQVCLTAVSFGPPLIKANKLVNNKKIF